MHSKRFCVFRQALLLLAAALAVVSVPSPGAAETTLERIQRTGKVVEGFYTDPPLTIINPDGTFGGALYELDKAILAEMGVSEIEAVFMEFGSLIPSVLSRRIDFMLAGANIRPERCERIIYAKPALCSEEALLVRIDTAGDVQEYKDLATKGLTFGMPRGSEPYTSIMKSLGVPESKIVFFTDYTDAIKLVMAGRVDAIPNNIISLEELQAKFGDPKVTKVVHVPGMGQCSANVFHPDDVDFRDAFNAAFEKVKQSGRYREILKKYGVEAYAETVDDPNNSVEKLCARTDP